MISDTVSDGDQLVLRASHDDKILQDHTMSRQ